MKSTRPELRVEIEPRMTQMTPMGFCDRIFRRCYTGHVFIKQTVNQNPIRAIRGSIYFMANLVHQDLSESIIGSAMKVLNTLSPGLDEKLYENALAIELRKRGHLVQQQRQFPVHYDGHLIGTLIPDLIVDDLVVVDPKVATAFNESHLAQMLGYLTITELNLAILLNFKYAKLDWKRVVR